jgi:hypothetical protein
MLLVAFPNDSSAYVYRYNRGYNTYNSGIYSRKTTAYNNIYNPLRRSYSYYHVNNLSLVNPYEARRVNFVLSQEKYKRDAIRAEARADFQYAQNRLRRQEKEHRQEALLKQRSAAKNRVVAGKADNKKASNNSKLLLAEQKSDVSKKDLSVVSSSDFNLISESLEQNANYKYVPKKQKTETVVLATAEQPSFFQRLRWALFGRN